MNNNYDPYENEDGSALVTFILLAFLVAVSTLFVYLFFNIL